MFKGLRTTKNCLPQMYEYLLNIIFFATILPVFHSTLEALLVNITCSTSR